MVKDTCIFSSFQALPLPQAPKLFQRKPLPLIILTQVCCVLDSDGRQRALRLLCSETRQRGVLRVVARRPIIPLRCRASETSQTAHQKTTHVPPSQCGSHLTMRRTIGLTGTIIVLDPSRPVHTLHTCFRNRRFCCRSYIRPKRQQNRQFPETKSPFLATKSLFPATKSPVSETGVNRL